MSNREIFEEAPGRVVVYRFYVGSVRRRIATTCAELERFQDDHDEMFSITFSLNGEMIMFRSGNRMVLT